MPHRNSGLPVPVYPIVPVVRAAAYVRMSTEHQQYSIENQHAAIQRFADAHGITIVRSFVDAGKSGVGIHCRDALQELLRTGLPMPTAAMLTYDTAKRIRR